MADTGDNHDFHGLSPIFGTGSVQRAEYVTHPRGCATASRKHPRLRHGPATALLYACAWSSPDGTYKNSVSPGIASSIVLSWSIRSVCRSGRYLALRARGTRYRASVQHLARRAEPERLARSGEVPERQLRRRLAHGDRRRGERRRDGDLGAQLGFAVPLRVAA